MSTPPGSPFGSPSPPSSPSAPTSSTPLPVPSTPQIPATPIPSTPLSAVLTPSRRTIPRSGVRVNPTGTPTRPTVPGSPMSAFGSENGDPNENNNPRPPPPRPSNEEIQVLRGTDIEVSTVTKTFSEFLREFRSVEDSKIRSDLNAREKAIEEGESFDDELPQPDPTLKPHYLEILSKTFNSQSTAIELDCVHLYYHSPSTRRLYDWLESYPQEIVVQMDTCIREIFEEFYGESELPLQVRPFHFRTVSHMRSLSPESIDSMVTLRGMVLRSSPIIPDLKIGHFKCQVCGAARESTIDRGRISEPTTCDENGCGSRHSFALVHNRSTYTDKQLVRLQETPSEVPAGETPASITLFAYDDIVDSVRPGDRVEVTGVFRASPKRPNPKRTVCRAVFRTYVDVIHFRIVEAGEMGSASKVNSSFTDKRVEEIKELSKRPNVYEALTAALAPSIWELDDVKKGVLCMLFGGNQNHRAEHEDEENEEEQIVGNKGRKSNKRGDINILLCGDPGTSKSQLLGQVHKLAPRGVYTSGKGSSAVGLTASVVRDPETRDLVLESGALVLSDQGVCCIDEFDKMSETTRAILHEAMEQQTVSIAKAGIICSLNARSSILASANPIESRYNPRMSVVDNIKLPPTLLSRFDLIYLILDSPSVEGDRRLAKHLVGLYSSVEKEKSEHEIPQDLLKDYIAYARQNCHPTISDLAGAELIQGYLEMRKMGGNSKTITATPRQLESLIRLSEGLARSKLSPKVTRADVREAIRLMAVATQTAATDPRTGRIDMDMITTGVTMGDRIQSESLLKTVRQFMAENKGKRMVVGDIVKGIKELGGVDVDPEEIRDVVRVLDGEGEVTWSERGQTIFVKAGQ